jgi:hypothetical protein
VAAAAAAAATTTAAAGAAGASSMNICIAKLAFVPHLIFIFYS